MIVSTSREAYGLNLEDAVSHYAISNVESGRWLEVDLLERSQADFDSLLPQGIEVPNNYLFKVNAAETGSTVGFIGFFPILQQAGPS